MGDVAIRVEKISKQYRIGSVPEQYQTLRDSLARAVSAPKRWISAAVHGRDKSTLNDEKGFIWALRDVSFEVPKGQVLGVIGRNGAGKSTLLKILSRVTEPTAGYAEISGRVGALLEVGTGFHPELTGRENIYLNGAILGMKRVEINRKFDDIVAFSEVEQFIDTPVKRYSSGMYLRLAFAVAAHLEPEILVVDEVLAVGDAEFQRKCLGKMSDVAQEGRTVLFVSHNMSAILRLTERALVLDQGRLAMDAPTGEAVDFYMNAGFSEAGEHRWRKEDVPLGSAPFEPQVLRVRNSQGAIVDTIRSTEPLIVEFEYHLSSSVTGLRVGIYLLTVRGEYVFTSFDTDEPILFDQFGLRQAGTYVSRCIIPADFLNEGRYIFSVNASAYHVRRYFQDDHVLAVNIDPAGAPGKQWAEVRLGPVRPRLSWEIIRKSS